MIRSVERFSSFAAVSAFFFVKIGAALILLMLSTSLLSVPEFAIFTQLLILAALLNLLAIGGAQNGLISLSAVAPNEEVVARLRDTSIGIWATIFLLGSIAAVLFRNSLSNLLIGDNAIATSAVLVVGVTLFAGPGQIFTAILTGRRRVTASLAAQGAGITAGTAGAIFFLLHGAAAEASIAFASGPLVTMAIAWMILRVENLGPIRPRQFGAQWRQLISHSSATLVLALSTATILFGLRFLYQQAFGLDELGYWLAASRISDTTTQFLGLILIQLFLPYFAAIRDPIDARRLTFITWFCSFTIMACVFGIFYLASSVLIHTILGPNFMPATNGILIYLAGDVFRVWAALAMSVQLARGRPWRYASIEIATMLVMAFGTLFGISSGQLLAPMISYFAAYGATATIITIVFLRNWVRSPRLEKSS